MRPIAYPRASAGAQTSSRVRPKKSRYQAQSRTPIVPPIAPPYQTSPEPESSSLESKALFWKM